MCSEHSLYSWLSRTARVDIGAQGAAHHLDAVPFVASVAVFLVVLSAGCTTGAPRTTSAVVQSPHTVQLSWPPSSTTNVTYNVYRCGSSNAATATANCVQSSPGNFSKVGNAALNTLTFTDSNLTSGQTYVYAVTAVDSSSIESGLSGVSNAVSVP